MLISVKIISVIIMQDYAEREGLLKTPYKSLIESMFGENFFVGDSSSPVVLIHWNRSTTHIPSDPIQTKGLF